MRAFFTLLGAVLVTAGLTLLIALAVSIPNRYSCHKMSEMMGMQSDYGLMTGCMVKVGDHYFPRENIRLVNGEIVVDMAGD